MGKSAGKVMPRPRGAYNESETYKILDMVTLDNKLWIAKQSGITGITPSKTATEWMMAVDGTTDVKALETEVEAKFASIDEQFLAKDTQISGLDTRVTEAEGSIAELDGKFVFDDTPTKGSTNLIRSGAIYSINNGSTSTTSDDGKNYVRYDRKLITDEDTYKISTSSEYKTINDDGTVSHIVDNGYFLCEQSRVDLYSERIIGDENTKENQSTCFSNLTINNYAINIRLQGSSINNGIPVNLTIGPDSFKPLARNIYDLGASMFEFKDIYAMNGTIQTSDLNAKKDIADLSSEQITSIIMGLRPVSFKFIDGTSDRTHYGLIAQEVETLVNGLGIDNKDFAPLIKTEKVDEDGSVIDGEYTYGLRYSEFTGLLIKMCQNLQNEVDDLKARLGGA